MFGYVAKRRGLATEGIWALIVAGVIGGLAGANLVQLLVAHTPGKTIIGAIACGYLAIVYTRSAASGWGRGRAGSPLGRGTAPA